MEPAACISHGDISATRRITHRQIAPDIALDNMAGFENILMIEVTGVGCKESRHQRPCRAPPPRRCLLRPPRLYRPGSTVAVMTKSRMLMRSRWTVMFSARPSNLSVIQTNLQHKQIAAATLRRQLEVNTGTIALIQEPWIRGSRICGLSNIG
ncbi:hypothetical protein JYU34_017193, partial [Plutella xylostella]